MSRSKKPGWWSPDIGVYDRTISFCSVWLFELRTGRVAAMEMC